MITISQDLVLKLLGSDDEFCVDLDNAWRWIGYKAKRNAKESLIKNFVDGTDFLRNSTKSSTGGRCSEHILLTIDCFKSLAMMAGTEQGREVRKYFLQCERQLKEIRASQQSTPAVVEKRVEAIESKQLEMEAKQSAVEAKVEALEAKLERQKVKKVDSPIAPITDDDRLRNIKAAKRKNPGENYIWVETVEEAAMYYPEKYADIGVLADGSGYIINLKLAERYLNPDDEELRREIDAATLAQEKDPIERDREILAQASKIKISDEEKKRIASIRAFREMIAKANARALN